MWGGNLTGLRRETSNIQHPTPNIERSIAWARVETLGSLKANSRIDTSNQLCRIRAGGGDILLNMTADAQLLRDYATGTSQDAFTELVRRHVDLVYSAALRQVRSPELAEEVSQSVFTDLARTADSLKPDTILAAWLYQVTRRTAIDVVRRESRRQARERLAVEMAAMNTAADWNHIEPLLEDAMETLDETDRAAILLRYFENKSLREVGETLGTSDDAAQKRVSRAVERLREFFSKRGVAVGASGLVVVISANAVQAAPVALISNFSTAAVLTGTTVHASTAIAATKVIAMTTFQKTIVTAALAVVATAGIYEAHQAGELRKKNRDLRQEQVSLADKVKQLQQQHDEFASQLADLTAENARLKANSNDPELLRLRAEVARMRGESDDPALASVKSVTRKVAQLKQRLEEKPAWKIPELQFISDKDWAEGAWDIDLSTDDGVRDALSRVRETAINKFLNEMMKAAMKKYLTAHGNTLPDSLTQLEPYFDVPVTDDMLARYKLVQIGQVDNRATLVRLLVNVDDDYDSNHTMSINGATGARFNGTKQRVESAVMDYVIDHEGQMPSSSTQISSYLKTPMEDVTIQKYLTQMLADPMPPETLVLLPAVKAYTKANNGKMPADAKDLMPFVTTDVQKAAIQKLSAH